MGKKKTKQYNKSKNQSGTNAKNAVKPEMEIGLRENVRVVHSDENNPHDG